MKVTFEIEIPDELVDDLDYYKNYGNMNGPKAGCKKCMFYGMCSYFTNRIRLDLDWDNINCKFPCWKTERDHSTGANRHVYVLKTNSDKI